MANPCEKTLLEPCSLDQELVEIALEGEDDEKNWKTFQ